MMLCRHMQTVIVFYLFYNWLKVLATTNPFSVALLLTRYKTTEYVIKDLGLFKCIFCKLHPWTIHSMQQLY